MAQAFLIVNCKVQADKISGNLYGMLMSNIELPLL